MKRRIKTPEQQLIAAIERNNLSKFYMLFAQGINCNYVDKTGYSILMYAIAKANIPMVKFLMCQPNLNINYQTNHQYEEGFTALILATDIYLFGTHAQYNGDKRDDDEFCFDVELIVILLLMHSKIDLSINDDNGRNIGNLAAQYKDIFKEILDEDIQNIILRNNVNNILFLEKYGLVHPNIKKNNPALFKASEWGLIV